MMNLVSQWTFGTSYDIMNDIVKFVLAVAVIGAGAAWLYWRKR